MIKHAGLIIIDEIRESLTKMGICFLEEFIDKRYASGLPTMFISNHTFDSDTSYKRLTIQKVLGDRNSDRLRNAIVCEFNGKSKRGLRHPDSITEEEKGNFCFPPSVLALGDDKRQILNLVTRNQIFEPINRKDRKITRNNNGEPIYRDGVPADAPREKPKVSENIWQKGDSLILGGPILCGQDARTYITCLHLLKRQHQKGYFGLSLRITPTHLMRALELNESSLSSKQSLHRSLRRISAATFDYRDKNGREWVGPLFVFRYQPTNSEGAYLICFNESMIDFYKLCEFTVLSYELLKSQIGTDGLRIQMFLLSHASSSYIPDSLIWWLEFLDKPVKLMDDTPVGKALTRKLRKKFSETIRKQVELGFLTADSCLTRDGKVVLTLVPENLQRVS